MVNLTWIYRSFWRFQMMILSNHLYLFPVSKSEALGGVYEHVRHSAKQTGRVAPSRYRGLGDFSPFLISWYRTDIKIYGIFIFIIYMSCTEQTRIKDTLKVSEQPKPEELDGMVILGSDMEKEIREILRNTRDILSQLRPLCEVHMARFNQIVNSSSSNTRKPLTCMRPLLDPTNMSSDLTVSTTQTPQLGVINPTVTTSICQSTKNNESLVHELPSVRSAGRIIQRYQPKTPSVRSLSRRPISAHSSPSTVQKTVDPSVKSPVLSDPLPHITPKTQPM